MAESFRQFGLRAISGQQRSFVGMIVRALTAIVEPFYAGVMRGRDACYRQGWFRTHALGRPTISVGNITTGGTGKTPVVLWLASCLRDRGCRPAILLRGYGSASNGDSDERQLLDAALNHNSAGPIPVRANPSRIDSAKIVVTEHPGVNVFILDDAFQHRKVQRDFNLVLISSTEPFGFNHVLPRGLLREPLNGLERADAFLLTRASQASSADLIAIQQVIRRFNPSAPIYRSDHVHTNVYLPGTGERVPMGALTHEKVFAFAGIGDPESFRNQLSADGCNVVGHHWFTDHHAYSRDDISQLKSQAAQIGATVLLTTRKDWVKVLPLIATAGRAIQIGVVELSIVMPERDEHDLLANIVRAIGGN